VPGWHDDTRALQEAGTLQMIGIIQEQHPDRCRLFMQWKQMTWPILVDPLNLYGIDVVPATYAIDEFGIVRFVNPSRPQFEQFMTTRYPAPTAPLPDPPAAPDLRTLEARARRARSSAAWGALGDALFLWGGEKQLDATIDAFERAARLDPKQGALQFRLGTALKRRDETSRRRADDFRRAVDHWARALEMNPNQYIWRRRLQQYGPREDKPYPFYDWIDEARRDIRARGATPEPLRIEPVGAEIALPARAFTASEATVAAPDPRGRIIRDKGRLVLTESAAVPPRVAAGKTTRIHLVFRPNAVVKAHWNNETEPLRVWVSVPEGWAIDTALLSVANPPEVLSTEARHVQFELQTASNAAGLVRVPAYALYYVCEDVDGTCLYRRQDIDVTVELIKQ
jgi:hypothetical protein